MDDVRGWFDGYLDAFAGLASSGASDFGSLLEYYAVPLLLTTEAEAHVVADADQVLGFASAQAQGLAAERYASSEVLSLEIDEINGSSCWLRASFSRRRDDGSEIARLSAAYLIADGVDGRRIFAIALTG